MQSNRDAKKVLVEQRRKQPSGSQLGGDTQLAESGKFNDNSPCEFDQSVSKMFPDIFDNL